MKTLSLEQMENVEGGKLFGRSSRWHPGDGNGGYCTNHFSFLGITWQTGIYTASSAAWCDYQVQVQ